MVTVMQYKPRRVAQAFGLSLRAIRVECGISQDQLNAVCDLDRTYPSLLERGLRGPTTAMLLRLADGLGVEAARLLADTQARLRGASPINDRLYRLASLHDGKPTPIGRAYSNVDEARSDALFTREPRCESSMSPLAVVIYEAVNSLELPRFVVTGTRESREL